MTNKSKSKPEILLFSQLCVGDRFSRASKGDVWTKIDADCARRHSLASMQLGARGYGYHGDGICTFYSGEKIEFIPVTDPAL